MFGLPVKARVPQPVTKPVFGASCVCCNASTTRTEVGEIEVPVCEACKDHAIGVRGGTVFAIPLCIAGAMLVAAGTAVHHDASWFYVGGAALFAAGLALNRAAIERQRRRLPAGHHPGLELGLYLTATLVDTDNEALVERLLELNSNAQRISRGAMPKAKLVERD